VTVALKPEYIYARNVPSLRKVAMTPPYFRRSGPLPTSLLPVSDAGSCDKSLHKPHQQIIDGLEPAL